MNSKAAQTLELPKILEQLAGYTSFSGGQALARGLEPTNRLDVARHWIAEVTEARNLLEERTEQFSLGGVFDVRGAVMSTTRGIVLDPPVLLDIRSTLRRATTIRRTLSRMKGTYPILADLAEDLEECSAVQQEIGRIISEDGNVQDSASPKLAVIRRDMRIAYNRLQSKLTNLINNANNLQFLQEQLITQRNGRYVIPIKSEFKGRIPGIVHDQSASGATLWIEPLQTVETNNEYRELQLQEEKEVHRILRELCEFIGHESQYIVRSIEVLAYLDLVFAKAHYANTLRANPPSLVDFVDRPELPKHPGLTLKLFQARHPLLDPNKVVPIDLELDDQTYILVITGPNTGGKTVTLKTVGLMILMAQCGLHLPTDRGCELSVFDEIYADIGDEQSIEQSLSTFSSHMKNIINILDRADSRSLVVLDELGAGTDPTEGSALARAILNRLVDSGITTLVTTHHPELKIYSQERKGVRNASVEFNLDTLAPTYRLVVGLPGRSNALSIASRLGLPDDIIEDARHMVPVDDLVADDLLDEITKTREDLRRANAAAALARQEVEDLRDKLQQELDSIEIEKRDVLAETRRKAEYEAREFRQELKRLRKDMQTAGQPLEAIKALERATDHLKINLEMPEAATSDLVDEKTRPLRLGDTVWVTALKTEGTITELGTEDAEVAVGQLRVRTRLDELEYRKSPEQPKTQRKSGDPLLQRAKSPGLELDLRGTRVEEAITKVEEYIDAAYMAQLPFVRIIHGKGTGVLRQAVRERLAHHPLIVRYASGTEKEGGDGVTVVSLVENY